MEITLENLQNVTYSEIQKDMLNTIRRYRKDIDTREGSLAWLGIAAAALEFANITAACSITLEQAFADTANRNFLIKRASERGLSPYPATFAVLQLETLPETVEIPLNARFSLNGLFFYNIGKIEDGKYKIKCETAGSIGNVAAGDILPVNTIAGLESCSLGDVLVFASDDEETEAFRQRYFESLTSEAFGGNKQDYKEKVNAIPGVGGCKIIRAWNEDINPASFIPPPATEAWLESLTASDDIKNWLESVYAASSQRLLTVGGTVKVLLIGADYGTPTDELIAEVQEALDPVAGEGDGLVPIGHVVFVSGVQSLPVTVGLDLTFEENFSFELLENEITAAVEAYFLTLRKTWSSSEKITLRMGALEAELLKVEGIQDVQNSQIEFNGTAQNLEIDFDKIPILSSVIDLGGD